MGEELKSFKGRIKKIVGTRVSIISRGGENFPRNTGYFPKSIQEGSQVFEGGIGYVHECIREGSYIEILYRPSDHQIVAHNLP